MLMTVVLWLAMAVGWLLVGDWRGAILAAVLTFCYYIFVVFFVPEKDYE